MTKSKPDHDSQIMALADQIDHDLRTIRRAMRRPLEAETAKGQLTEPQKAVMSHVVHNEGVNLRDLSRAISLAHSTVSGIVDRLEKQGLVERRPDVKDGRISCIYPTAVVREFVKERIPELNRGPLLHALGRASAADRAAIASAIRKLRELLA